MRYPVVRLDFGRGSYGEPGDLHKETMAQLDTIAEEAGITPRYDTAATRFHHLIQALHRQDNQRVAVLVDEYDKPILDTIEIPEIACANRDYLYGLYATIKDSDAHIEFAFLTGVSKFSTGQSVLRSQQPHKHHFGCALLGYLWLHRFGSGHGIRARATRPGSGPNPRVVQWL